MNALQVTHVTVRFGGVVAVNDVDLAVVPGEVVGLIGPNGSGKTSLLDAISGFEPYDGTVRIGGALVDKAKPHARAARGLGRTFQALELFDDLTVAENVGVTGRSDVDGALAMVGVRGLKHRRMTDLDNIERRFVALARALAHQPSVLLVDEVAAGLDRDAQARVSQCLRAVAEAGAGVVLVEHNFDLVLGLADRVVVLDHGVVIADAPPGAVRNNAKVIAAYLGAAS